MSELLRQEYIEIKDLLLSDWDSQRITRTNSLIYQCVVLCQKIADRPVKMLTEDEIEKIIFNSRGMHTPSLARAVEAAVHAKQREPDTVKFDYEMWSKGGWQAIELSECGTYTTTVSVIAPGREYTMERI